MDMPMSMTSSGMGSTSMSMQTVATAAMPTTGATMGGSSSMDTTKGMGSGSMDMGAGSCKISMLWNWHTIDACFISSSWHITSKGMFAGSCIGVVCLVCTLECLRRLSREYDRYIALKAHQRTCSSSRRAPSSVHDGQTVHGQDDIESTPTAAKIKVGSVASSSDETDERNRLSDMGQLAPIGPTIPQQMVRAVLHMLQFGVAYFIMLLAMYYNGFIIICILIGALVGAFAFSWDLSTTTPADGSRCCG